MTLKISTHEEDHSLSSVECLAVGETFGEEQSVGVIVLELERKTWGRRGELGMEVGVGGEEKQRVVEVEGGKILVVIFAFRSVQNNLLSIDLWAFFQKSLYFRINASHNQILQIRKIDDLGWKTSQHLSHHSHLF